MPYLAENCLIIVPLEEGMNEIELEYHTPYLAHGIAVTVISALLLICWYVCGTEWFRRSVSNLKRGKEKKGSIV